MTGTKGKVCYDENGNPQPPLAFKEKMGVAAVGVGALAANLAIYAGAAKGNGACITYTVIQGAITLGLCAWVAWGTMHDA